VAWAWLSAGELCWLADPDADAADAVLDWAAGARETTVTSARRVRLAGPHAVRRAGPTRAAVCPRGGDDCPVCPAGRTGTSASRTSTGRAPTSRRDRRIGRYRAV
jgi:hypothetical protein